MARLELTLGVVAIVLTGCSQLAKQGELSESLAVWNALKTENGNSYRYETSFGSWAGFGDTTTLTVHSGEVVVRAYEAYITNGEGEQEITSSWTERARHLAVTRRVLRYAR